VGTLAVLLLRSRASSTALPIAGGIGFFLLLLPLLLIVAVITLIAGSQSTGGTGTSTIGPGSPIPAALVPVFNQAGHVWSVNPYLLASEAYQESTFGTGAGWSAPNSAGCVGFIQLCIGGAGGDSWDSPITLTGPGAGTVLVRDAFKHGPRPASYPLQTANHPNYDDAFDATMGAAIFLRGKIGGRPIPNLDQSAYEAACGYYGQCGGYASPVLARARAWQAQSALSPATASGPSPVGGGRLSPPLRSMVSTSPFCTQRSYESCHPGLDLAASDGTPVYASAAGRVSLEWPAPGGGYGNFICVDHGAGLSTCYAHLQHFLAQAGQSVQRGQQIGVSDSTGHVTGPHLHYEVRINGQVTCPAAYLGVSPDQSLGGGASVCAPSWQSRLSTTNTIPGA